MNRLYFIISINTFQAFLFFEKNQFLPQIFTRDDWGDDFQHEKQNQHKIEMNEKLLFSIFNCNKIIFEEKKLSVKFDLMIGEAL